MSEHKSSYKDILDQTEFLKLMGANAINRFGDSIDAIAFSWLAYQITGSPVWLAMIYAVNAIPNILFQPFVGAIVEKINKKTAMIICDVARGILVSIIAILTFTGHINVYLLMTFTFLMSCFESIRMPAGSSIVPSVLDKDKYTHGLSLYSTVSQISQFIGMSCAGAIIGFFGVKAAIMIDAVTFFLSALILLNIKPKREYARAVQQSGPIAMIKEGFVYFSKQKSIFILCLVTLFTGLLIMPLSVLQTPYVVSVLKLDAKALSVIGMSVISGIAMGSYLFPQLKYRFGTHKVFTGAGCIAGIFYLFLPLLGYLETITMIYLTLIVVGVVIGFAVGCVNTAINVSLILHVDPNYLSRVTSMYHALSLVSVPIGSLLVSMLLLMMDTPKILFLYGIVGLMFFTYLFFSPTLKDL